MADQPVATGETLNTAPTPPLLSKKSRFRKVIKVILIIVGILAGIGLIIYLLPFILGFVTSDIAPPNVDDLKLEATNIPMEDNAYYDLLAIGGLEVSGTTTTPIKETVSIYQGSGELGSGNLTDHLNGKEWDEKFVEDIVSKNSGVFAVFDKAVSKTKYEDPNNNPSRGMSNSSIMLYSASRYRSVGRIDAIKALSLFKQGKEKEGMDEAIKIINFGQKIQDSHGILILYLIGVSTKDVGLNALTTMIEKANLPSDKLIPYIKELERFKNNNEGLIDAFKGEYLTLSATLDIEPSSVMPFDKGINEKFYFRPNETKQLLADAVREMIVTINKPCAVLTKDEDKWGKEIEKFGKLSFVDQYFTENLEGKILSKSFPASMGLVIYRKCNEEFHVSASQLLLAIKAYKIDKGDYPPSLDDLVPDYIDSVPNDPYSNQPIKYSLSKKIIYSVGKDGVDAGGSEGEDWQKMPDPTFPIAKKIDPKKYGENCSEIGTCGNLVAIDCGSAADGPLYYIKADTGEVACYAGGFCMNGGCKACPALKEWTCEDPKVR